MDSEKLHNYPSAPPPPYNSVIVQPNNSSVVSYIPNESLYYHQNAGEMNSQLIKDRNRSSFGVACLECLECCTMTMQCLLCCCTLAQCVSK